MSQAVAIAQEAPVCFQVLPSGQVVDLRTLCRGDEVQNSDEAMSPQEIYQRGFSKARKRLYQEAISDFNRAIRTNPQYTDAYIARAYAQLGAGNLQEAVKDFEQAAKLYRDEENLERAEIVQQSAERARKDMSEK